MLTIRLFARLREVAGRAEWTLALPAGVADVASLRAHLAASDPRLAALAPTEPGVRAAVNQQMAGLHTAVGDGDEVAFFPPVTGG